MHIELVTSRRVLLKTYQRYLDADRDWEIAQHEVDAWFPTENRTRTFSMGNPGSTVRRKYACRERALQQLQVARLKLETARKRLVARGLEKHPLQTMFNSYLKIQ
jgi:hypothetical protein